MKRFFVGWLAVFCLCGTTLPARGQKAELAPASDQPSPGGVRAREFQNDDLGQVLRLLARQAKIDVAVGENVKGSVTLRLENSTAREAFDVVVRQAKLSVTQDDKGVLYVATPDPADATLALLAKPEVATAIAAYKANLYNALLKEGFMPEQALKIVLATDLGEAVSALDRKANVSPSK